MRNDNHRKPKSDLSDVEGDDITIVVIS